MRGLTAEEYLGLIKKIDAIIANKLQDHARWVEIAEGLGGASVSEKVQSSRNMQQTATAIGNYVDIEKEIKDLNRERQEIIRTIEQLPFPEYETMYLLYVRDFTLKEVAYHFKRSYDWAKAKKRTALQHLQEIIDEKKGLTN